MSKKSEVVHTATTKWQVQGYEHRKLKLTQVEAALQVSPYADAWNWVSVGRTFCLNIETRHGSQKWMQEVAEFMHELGIEKIKMALVTINVNTQHFKPVKKRAKVLVPIPTEPTTRTTSVRREFNIS